MLAAAQQGEAHEMDHWGAAGVVSCFIGLCQRPLPAAETGRDDAAPERSGGRDHGHRKNLSGPFPAWLRSPEMADRFQRAGEYVRYNTALSKALSEFVILVTAREWTCQIEWYLHVPEATAAGVDPKVIADLVARKRPAALFNRVRARFGDKGVVDIIGINGYYDAVAMTINAADQPMPPGITPPLD
jgi:4-carboxymuconolactone decarboxylase